MKPNLAEFHELIGHRTQSLDECIKSSRDLCDKTGILLARSMSDEGLLSTVPDSQWLLSHPGIRMYLSDGVGQNVIGCGDALVGALAYGYCRLGNVVDAAKPGLAAAHYKLSTFGVPEIEPDAVRKLVNQVQIQNLQRND